MDSILHGSIVLFLFRLTESRYCEMSYFLGILTHDSAHLLLNTHGNGLLIQPLNRNMQDSSSAVLDGLS